MSGYLLCLFWATKEAKGFTDFERSRILRIERMLIASVGSKKLKGTWSRMLLTTKLAKERERVDAAKRGHKDSQRLDLSILSCISLTKPFV